ncbi:hypothetical protein LOD59_07940, partial [Xylella fastidiosa subsp. multiplex]|uniref:hypothetical protein n=1 Tax=Xylella fastidiosa TaxID=2371 RepID=UPI0023602CFC
MTSGALRITLTVFLVFAFAENFTPLVDAGEVPDLARVWSRLAVLAAFCDRTRKPFSNHPSSGSKALMGSPWVLSQKTGHVQEKLLRPTKKSTNTTKMIAA